MSAARPRDGVNAVAWLLWFAGALVLPLVSRNPLYLALELLIVAVVYLSLPRGSRSARAWRTFLLIGLTLAIFSIGFNLLTVHVGDRAFARLPDWLPIVGGKLTWNAFAYGLVSALAVATLLVAAAAFNTATRHGDLVRLAPAGLARLGVAGSIALTMVPQTIAAGRDIIDAQRSRGHRVRGVRDAGSLIVPLLATGLERAVTLSEALEVRGFGAPLDAPARPHRRIQQAIAAGLLLVALVAIGLGWPLIGLPTLAVAVGVALRTTTGIQRRTRLRRVRWDRASVAVAVGAGATIVALLVVVAVARSTLAWDPFPRLAAPTAEPLIGAALLGLLFPALFGAGR